MQDFYFKTVDTSVSLRVKHAVPIQYLRSDEMLTGLMSVSLLMYTVFVVHSSLARANAVPCCISLH